MTGTLLLLLLAADGGALEWSPIQLTATQEQLMPDGGTRLGPLTFRGAVELTSSAETFGGLSGLRWWNGKFYAVSDKRGTLFRFTPKHDATGALIGVESTGEAAAIEVGDAEALEFTEQAMLVSNEDSTTLSSFPLDAGNIGANSTRSPMPQDAAWGLGHNKGFEAMAVSKGCALLFAEQARTGFIGKSDAMTTAAPNLSALAWPEDFSPTDVVWVTPGKLAYVVLRKFDGKAYGGLARVTTKGCAPAGLKLEVLAQWGAPMLVDNFEALAVVAGPKELTLYVLSDDNFRSKGPQRTLLLEFTIPK